MIKYKGLQVAPAELEAHLISHDLILDAAVIGVPYKGDEAPRAYIVLAEGKRATEEDINQWFEKRVTRTKRLTGGIKFVREIPKNPVSAMTGCDLTHC